MVDDSVIVKVECAVSPYRVPTSSCRAQPGTKTSNADPDREKVLYKKLSKLPIGCVAKEGSHK